MNGGEASISAAGDSAAEDDEFDLADILGEDVGAGSASKQDRLREIDAQLLVNAGLIHVSTTILMLSELCLAIFHCSDVESTHLLSVAAACLHVSEMSAGTCQTAETKSRDAAPSLLRISSILVMVCANAKGLMGLTQKLCAGGRGPAKAERGEQCPADKEERQEAKEERQQQQR